MSHSWSVEKSVITLLMIATISILAYSYSRNEYFFSDQVRWADLSFSTDREEWKEQMPDSDSLWIRGKLWIQDSTHDYNGLFIGIDGNYEVFWDGVWVGRNGSEDEKGTINFYQPLDSAQVTPGSHMVEAQVIVKGFRLHDDMYAGMILGNIRGFTFDPLVQFSCVAVLIGLLLVLWATLYNKKWAGAALWLVATNILYLLLNFSKTIYNYPVDYHGIRLMLYGFSTILLSLALINYSLRQINLTKYQWTILPFSLVLSSIFLIASYDEARWYILIIGQVISMTILLIEIRQFKKALLIIIHLYLLVVVQFEVGFLMVIGYLAIVLIDYFESTLPEQVELKIKDPPTHLMASFAGEKKLVMLSEVVAIKGANNYSELILMNQERYLCDKSLGKLMEEVPAHFARVHKSFIVDLRRVDTIRTNRAGGRVLTLKNQLELPVGRTYKYEVIDRFN